MMISSAENRRLAVLRAIVTDYIKMREPVGSKALVDRHNLEVSSATIRNDMAVLEAEGYIVQQHASSGRIPTDAGYRYFVDRLEDIKPLSRSERKAIAQFLESGVDLEDTLRRSVQLLAQLTHQVAVIQYPVLSASTVRHLEVVRLSPTKLLLVLITDTGRVEQRTVDLGQEISEDDVPSLRNLLSAAMHDKKLPAASAAISELADSVQDSLKVPLIKTISVLVETLVEKGDERFIVGGAANLTRNVSDFEVLPGALLSILEALEEQVVLLKLLSSTSESVSVKIGSENQDAPIPGAAVVSANYGSSAHRFGTIGVVGPTRMDYPGTISSVMAVASYVGEILSTH